MSSTNYSNWMSNYKNVPFKLLSIPGAHDAGMYKMQNATNLGAYGDGDNVLTQSKDFYDMLKAGIRYFDVRPGYFIERDGTKIFRTGHFAPNAGGVGACGADLSDVLGDVIKFVSDSSVDGQFVILKFSHYFQLTDIDNSIDNLILDDGSSTFDTFKSELVAYVNSVFAAESTNWLFKSTNDNITSYKAGLNSTQLAEFRVWDCPLGDLLDGRNRVLLVFDAITEPGVLSAANRNYSFADMVPDSTHNPTNVLYGSNLPAGDFVIYDCYSNENSYDDIKKDQKNKFNTSNYHTGDLYLYSWTATQSGWNQFASGFPLIGTSIKDLAQELNAKLSDGIKSLSMTIASSLNHASKIPNIIYTDYSDTFATDECISINNGMIQKLTAAEETLA